MVSCSGDSLCIQLYRLTGTNGAVTGTGRRKDGTIGGSGSSGLLENYVTGLIGVIRNNQHIIFTRDTTRNGAGFIRKSGITA